MSTNNKLYVSKEIMGWIVFSIVIIVMLLAFIYGFNFLFKTWLDTIQKLFGNDTVGLIFLHLIIVSSIGIIYLYIFYFTNEKSKGMFNFWFHFTLVLAFILLYVGTIGVSLIVGVPNLDSVLRDKNNNYSVVGEIKCSSSNYFIENSQINCEISKPKVVGYSSRITLIGENFSKVFINTNKISFEALSGTKSIAFEINGVDINNNVLDLNVGRQFEFLSESKASENRDKRVAYMIALLGIILFSVPTFILNLRTIYRNN